MKYFKNNFLSPAIVILLLVSQEIVAQNYNGGNTLPGGGPLAKETAKNNNGFRQLKKVVIVYKTHFDIGYSETVQQVLHDYRTSMTDKVLQAIEKNKQQPKDQQFVWTLSGWPMTQILWEGQEPARKEKIESAIRNKNLYIHALPFSMHSETADLEGMVRGLSFSSALARKYGLPLPASAKMSDVPGQSWLLPTLLTHAGVRFYHMGGPVVNKTFGLPDFFWWQGPDGSKLLTLYNNGYGSSPLPPQNWPYKTWLYISMTGDNQGPPDPETVAKDIAFYKTKGIEAVVGTMDDFASLVLKEDLSSLPVIRADIGDPWIHGTMSMPEACKEVQNTRPDIGNFEALNTLENFWGIYRPGYSALIAKAYESSLMFSEHTWGLANQHYIKTPYGTEWTEQWKKGLPAQFSLMEDSWKDHADYAGNVNRLIGNPYKDAIASLADHVKVSANHITVYNPLPWARSGEVQIDTRLIFGNQFVSLKPVDGGALIPVSHEKDAIEDRQPFSRFVVNDIPAMGYRTYIISDEKAPEAAVLYHMEQGVLESPFFKATIDAEKGCITSLIDKRSGKELVDVNAPQGFGQYFYERFSYARLDNWLARSLYPQYKAHKFSFVAYDMPKDSSYFSMQPAKMKLSMEKTAIDVKAILTGEMNTANGVQQVTMTLTLDGFNPYAEVSISWQKQPDSWPEAGWLCLPFKVDNSSIRLGRLGAIANPATDMNVKNANHYLWWVNNGAAIFDSVTKAGIAICSPDLPLLSIGKPGEYEFDSVFTSRKPYIYLNLYNNHWRTNFPAWVGNGQRMEAKVRLWSYNNYDAEATFITPAAEVKVPLQAAASKLQTGQLPVVQSGLQLSRKGVAVTCFGGNPDGKGLLIRLWEQVGNSGKLTVQLPGSAKIKWATPVNLRGEQTGEKLPVQQNKFTFLLSSYQPASFILSE